MFAPFFFAKPASDEEVSCCIYSLVYTNVSYHSEVDSMLFRDFYSYGKHLVPHNAAVHEYSTGLSRIEVAKNHGIHFTVAPDIGINESIDAARNILNRCWFDEEKCSKGIHALENYRKEWNERQGCWASQPLHNFASHGADAFRMLAVGIGKLATQGLTAEGWKALGQKYI